MQDQTVIARIESMLSNGHWWDGSMIDERWHGKSPGSKVIGPALRQMIASGRLETNGYEGRGRKLKTAGTIIDPALDAIEVEAAKIRRSKSLAKNKAKREQAKAEQKQKPEPELAPQPEPEPEQPIIVAIYKDHVEMPFSSLAQMIERVA